MPDFEIVPLSNIDGALEASFSALANRHTGMGTWRDKSKAIAINPTINKLDEQERNALIRSSNIARKAVMIYPLEAARGWVEFMMGSAEGVEPHKLSEYFDNLATGSLKNAFKEASIEGRWHGDGYVLLGIDDDQNWDHPIDEKRIKSFRWVEPIGFHECLPDNLGWSRKPSHYRLSIQNRELPGQTNKNFIRVHHSRILRFPGNQLYGSALYNNANQNDSILQVMFDAFSDYFQGLFSASAMLSDYSVFKYKLKGLAKLVQEGSQDLIMNRFLTIQMGMSVMKGLAMDADNEDAEFVQRSFGGVKEILEALLTQLVAATDVPRYKLLASAEGENLNQNKGEQERFDWASAINSWQVDHWDEPLRYCIRMALLSKDGVTGGVLPDGYGHKFRNTLQLSPLEEIELRERSANTNKINIEAGLYTAFEARMSNYAGSQWSYEITLDERVTQQMEAAIKNPAKLEPVPENPNPTNQTETDLKNPLEETDSQNVSSDANASTKEDSFVDIQSVKRQADSEYTRDSKVKKIVQWKNLSLGLEVLPGEQRFSKTLSGVAYGHIQNHIGEDKKALDCYVAESIINGSYSGSQICRIAQLNQSGHFDEYKYFLGFTVTEAKQKYFELMPSSFFGGVYKTTLKDIGRFKRRTDSAEVTTEEFDAIADIDILKIAENIFNQT